MEINFTLVGRRIRQARLRQHMTQEDLAFELDTSIAYISSIERGIKKPSLKRLSELAHILDMPIPFLLYGSENSDAEVQADIISSMMASCPPDKQQQLLNSISSIIQLFTTE